KWDLVEKDHKTFDNMMESINYKIPELKNIPKLSVSAKTGQRIDKIFDMCINIYTNMKKQISQAPLKQWSQNIFEKQHHPAIAGRNIKMWHIEQSGTLPPTFKVFVNFPGKVMESYKRYIHNQLLEEYDFSGCPIRFNFLRHKSRRERFLKAI
ncbi:MAG: hypothetical protein ABIA63_07495, partial [bacterium]